MYKIDIINFKLRKSFVSDFYLKCKKSVSCDYAISTNLRLIYLRFDLCLSEMNKIIIVILRYYEK